EVFQGKATTPIQGNSLLPVFLGQPRDGHEWLYFQFSNNRAVRQGDWKAVSAAGGRWELYNLASDRSELNDLAAAQPERTQQLIQLWHNIAENIDQAPKNLRKPATDKVSTFPAKSMTARKAGSKAEAEADSSQ
ncbi:MAG: hypothetical protein KDA89_09240, partial [Planctomycetaceae bacterium]|nr:hypothetical protein [Planctomycetaceae bacterium]